MQLQKEVFSPGETVLGDVVVVAGGKSRSFTASLEYHEETDDYERVATRVSSGPLHLGALVTGMRFEFALQLPAGALPNYRSDHGELYWDVHVQSDELGFDTHVRQRVTVELRGQRLAM